MAGVLLADLATVVLDDLQCWRNGCTANPENLFDFAKRPTVKPSGPVGLISRRIPSRKETPLLSLQTLSRKEAHLEMKPI